MAELIASGTTELASADFTLTEGQSANLFLTAAAGPDVAPDAVALVQIKSGANYFTVGRLDYRGLGKVLNGAGTYRVLRKAGAAAFGVDKS